MCHHSCTSSAHRHRRSQSIGPPEEPSRVYIHSNAYAPALKCLHVGPNPFLGHVYTSAARVFGQQRRCDHHTLVRAPRKPSDCARRARACPSPWLALASTRTAPPRSPSLHVCWCAPVWMPHCPTHSCVRVLDRGVHTRTRAREHTVRGV